MQPVDAWDASAVQIMADAVDPKIDSVAIVATDMYVLTFITLFFSKNISV